MLRIVPNQKFEIEGDDTRCSNKRLDLVVISYSKHCVCILRKDKRS